MLRYDGTMLGRAPRCIRGRSRWSLAAPTWGILLVVATLGLTGCGGGGGSAFSSNDVVMDTSIPSATDPAVDLSVPPKASYADFTTIPAGLDADLTPDADAGAEPSGTEPVVTLSGTIEYVSYAPTASDGLDYASPENRPCRRVPVVATRTFDGGELARGVTDDIGGYTFDVPSDISVTVTVWAALGTVDDPSLLVVDPDNGVLLWTVCSTAEVGSSDLDHDILIPGGWDDSAGAYTPAERLSGAWAIVDAIRAAEDMLLAADGSADVPDLLVAWGPDNGRGSYYSGGIISLYGLDGVDTDEFDRAIVIHEWVHFYEDVFARSDSLGGRHGLSQRLDPTLAWGEGLASAMAGMVLDSEGGEPHYRDTIDDGDGPSTYIAIDIENRGFESFWGHWNELAIMQLVYDLYDDVDDSTSEGADTLGLGFAPIHQALRDGVSASNAYTCLYSFLSALKDIQHVDDHAQIDDICAMHGVVPATDAMGTDLDDDPLLDEGEICIDLGVGDGVRISSDPMGRDLQSREEWFDPLTGWPGNKHRQRWFFAFTAPEAGELDFGVRSFGLIGGGTGSVRIQAPGTSLASGSDAAAVAVVLESGETIYLSVSTPNGPTRFDVGATFTPVVVKVSN